MFVFGPGTLIATLAGGTPINIGYAQEITFEDKSKTVPLYGLGRRALAVGGGTIQSTVKVKAAVFSGYALSQLWLGTQPVVGGTFAQLAEAHTLPASAPTVTVAPPHSGTFYADQGVSYFNTALPLTYTTGAPSTGQYSVNTTTGVYAFAAGDENAKILMNYTWTSGSYGMNVASTNPALGQTVTVGLIINVIDPTNNLTGLLQIYNCVFNNFSLASKLEDFEMPAIDGECFMNSAGLAWTWNFPTLA